jgi:hypothetical protein
MDELDASSIRLLATTRSRARDHLRQEGLFSGGADMTMLKACSKTSTSQREKIRKAAKALFEGSPAN